MRSIGRGRRRAGVLVRGREGMRHTAKRGEEERGKKQTAWLALGDLISPRYRNGVLHYWRSCVGILLPCTIRYDIICTIHNSRICTIYNPQHSTRQHRP
jgi:hypothetical protein